MENGVSVVSRSKNTSSYERRKHLLIDIRKSFEAYIRKYRNLQFANADIDNANANISMTDVRRMVLARLLSLFGFLLDKLDEFYMHELPIYYAAISATIQYSVISVPPCTSSVDDTLITGQVEYVDLLYKLRNLYISHIMRNDSLLETMATLQKIVAKDLMTENGGEMVGGGLLDALEFGKTMFTTMWTNVSKPVVAAANAVQERAKKFFVDTHMSMLENIMAKLLEMFSQMQRSHSRDDNKKMFDTIASINRRVKQISEEAEQECMEESLPATFSAILSQSQSHSRSRSAAAAAPAPAAVGGGGGSGASAKSGNKEVVSDEPSDEMRVMVAFSKLFYPNLLPTVVLGKDGDSNHVLPKLLMLKPPEGQDAISFTKSFYVKWPALETPEFYINLSKENDSMFRLTEINRRFADAQEILTALGDLNLRLRTMHANNKMGLVILTELERRAEIFRFLHDKLMKKDWAKVENVIGSVASVSAAAVSLSRLRSKQQLSKKHSKTVRKHENQGVFKNMTAGSIVNELADIIVTLVSVAYRKITAVSPPPQLQQPPQVAEQAQVEPEAKAPTVVMNDEDMRLAALTVPSLLTHVSKSQPSIKPPSLKSQKSVKPSLMVVSQEGVKSQKSVKPSLMVVSQEGVKSQQRRTQRNALEGEQQQTGGAKQMAFTSTETYNREKDNFNALMAAGAFIKPALDEKVQAIESHTKWLRFTNMFTSKIGNLAVFIGVDNQWLVIFAVAAMGIVLLPMLFSGGMMGTTSLFGNIIQKVMGKSSMISGIFGSMFSTGNTANNNNNNSNNNNNNNKTVKKKKKK